MQWRVALFISLALPWTCGAQDATASARDLELKLEPGQLVDGVPTAFTFKIINVSSHDVRVPQPVVECGGYFTGFIWLKLIFKPFDPNKQPQTGFGCAADVWGWPPILKRAQTWQLLHPGQSLDQTLPQDELHYESREPGNYEFWAEYTPPSVAPEDRTTLEKAGIHYSAEPLSTAHLSFRREP